GAAQGDQRTGSKGPIDREPSNRTAAGDRLPPLPRKELGGCLAAAEPRPVLGLRVSAGLATTFAYYTRRIPPDVRLLTHGGSELVDGLRAARRAGAEWLVAVVLPRYPVEVMTALEYAEKLGYRVAVICDRPGFPAEVVLDAPVGDRLVFDSHV